MTTIWKFSLGRGGRCDIDIPRGARLLSVQSQREQAVLWALCDSLAKPETRRFYVALTGERLYDWRSTWDFVGTTQLANGEYVVHVFEVPK